MYRIFSIKRPRRLFQTWPGGPGIYLKPAVNWRLAFINKVFFLPFYQVVLLPPNLRSPGRVGQDETFFPFIQSDKLSPRLVRITVTIIHQSFKENLYFELGSSLRSWQNIVAPTRGNRSRATNPRGFRSDRRSCEKRSAKSREAREAASSLVTSPSVFTLCRQILPRARTIPPATYGNLGVQILLEHVSVIRNSCIQASSFNKRKER